MKILNQSNSAYRARSERPLKLAVVFLFCFLLLPEGLGAQSGFGELFTWSPYHNYGARACETGKSKGDPSSGPCTNSLSWERTKLNLDAYYSFNDNSMTLTAGNDCRTLNTGSNNACVFNLGEGGITEISFDFEISGQCHTNECVDWLAFWIYSIPWEQSTEVDFVESVHGGTPGTPQGGLYINFAGLPTQATLFQPGPNSDWKGSVTAKFSGTGDNLSVTINGQGDGQPAATATSHNMARSTDYFFVFNTTPTTESNCSITVSNLQMKGTVAAGQCAGIVTAN